MKISEAFETYRSDYMRVRSMSASMIEHNIYYQKALVSFLGDIEIEKITSSDIGRWFSNLSKSREPNTVRNYICAIRGLFGYMNILGVKCLNKDLIPVPKRLPKVPEFLTAEEVASMISNTCNLRAKLVVSLLYSSGIRLSEFMSLNRGQIKDRRFTVVGKGGKIRLCFIDDRTELLLMEYLSERADDCEALVISKDKTRMTKTNVQFLVSNAARRAGISRKVTPHTLRHSFATNLLQNGMDIRYISQLMGHATIQTTALYTHVVDNDLEQKYRDSHTI